MSQEQSESWEKELVSKLALSAINEQRRARRWGIAFKLLFFIYITFILVLYMTGKTSSFTEKATDHTALVELKGLISAGSDANADTIVTGLRTALENPNSKALIIRANSPGGSPVQADYMYREILRLRKKYPDKPVYAVITDACASACYYIISATEKIYANEASLVGSIGVLSDGFGFVGAMEKLGVERRLYTAGSHKGTLDPFSPQKPEDVQHMNSLLKEVHQQFINAVKKGRGDRLKITDTIFSGLFWTGKRAKEMGLIDDFASAGMVARDVVKAKDLVDYTPKERLLDRLVDRLGASIATSILPKSELRMH